MALNSISHISQNGVTSPVGIDNPGYDLADDPEDPNEPENEDGIQTKEVEIQVDWNADLPVKVSVPKVSIHSIIFDFSQITFLDVVGVKVLKLVTILSPTNLTSINLGFINPLLLSIGLFSSLHLCYKILYGEKRHNHKKHPNDVQFLFQIYKEFKRIDVDVYIAACEGTYNTDLISSLKKNVKVTHRGQYQTAILATKLTKAEI